MEHLLTESEVVVFDDILNRIQGKERLYSNQLRPLNNEYFSRQNDIKTYEYSYYIQLIESHYSDYFKIRKLDGKFLAILITPLTKDLYNKGGFRTLYEKQQKELIETKKIEEIKLSNLFLENEEKRFRVKRQKTLYILTIIGSVVTVIGSIIGIISFLRHVN